MNRPGMIDGLDLESKQQKQEISALQQQVFEQQARLSALSTTLTLAGADLLVFFEPVIPIKRLGLGWGDVAA